MSASGVDASADGKRQALHEHLARWGLRRFLSDVEYFAWQRETLSPADLNQLHEHVKRKRSGELRDEIAFYDLTAQPHILPVLYSQRYDYYCEVGSRAASLIGEAHTVLDIGCGVGILTTFYAGEHPEMQFVGLDRSPASIAVAQRQAKQFGLTNVRFDCLDVEAVPLSGSYDLLIATHALVQAEQEPGIPSRSWRTFERSGDSRQQAEFEQRTGIDVRLDRLSGLVPPGGRLIVCEKTRQLARRVPFQRALAARGWRQAEQPEPIRYRLVEEVADDGPFYVLQQGRGDGRSWDESPEPDEGPPFNLSMLRSVRSHSGAPLYENHWPSAQTAWESLANRCVRCEETRQEPDGRQLHVELGVVEGYPYLYCANTFDQRQLILVDADQKKLLDTYYDEILTGQG